MIVSRQNVSWTVALCSILVAGTAAATIPAEDGPKVDFETVEYTDGKDTFQGFVATPVGATASRFPGVLIVHNWMGVSDETRAQAARIAALGYVVFGADVYGKGVRPNGMEQAGQLAGKFKGDRALFRARLLLSLGELAKHARVDAGRMFAVGYCFGGTGVIELARAGAAIKGVVSFHGGLDSPTPADGAKITARVLALHGADDPYVPAAELAAFEKEMATHGVDWQLVKFGGAVHSFSEKAAGNDKSRGAAYDARSDARSFQLLGLFLSMP
jgi:dienelactone hydrolase